MKIKIIKRANREKVMPPVSRASREANEPNAGKTMAETVKSRVEDFKRKSETAAALFKTLVRERNCL